MQPTAMAILIASAVLCPTQALLAAEPVSSGPGGTVFYSDGRIELSYYDEDGGSGSYGYADLDLGWEPQNGGLGFSLGIEVLDIENSDTDYALYPAVVYESGFGRFSIGVPRFVLDDNSGYMPKDPFGTSTLNNIRFRSFVSSAAALGYLAADVANYGLRYDGTFGNTKLGMSYHYSEDVGGMDIYNLAFRHDLSTLSALPELAVYGGYEHRSYFSLDSYRLGIEGGTDAWSAGVVLSRANHPMGDVDTALFYSTLQVSDALSASVAIANWRDTSSHPLYTLGVEYGFANGAYVKASYYDDDYTNGIDLSLGLEF